MTDVPTTVDAATTTDAPTLSIADIQNLLRVVDFAADQGAFKGWSTIEQVLMVRNRVNAFLLSVAPPEATSDTTADTPDASTGTEATAETATPTA